MVTLYHCVAPWLLYGDNDTMKVLVCHSLYTVSWLSYLSHGDSMSLHVYPHAATVSRTYVLIVLLYGDSVLCKMRK